MSHAQLTALLGSIDELVNIPNGISRIKENVLRLAVSGELIAEEPTDFSPKTYLATIMNRTADLAPSRKLKKTNMVASDQVGAEWWEPALLGNVATDISYGTSIKATDTGEVPIIRMGNIQNRELDLATLKFVSRSAEIDGLMLQEGDFLFNRTNSPALVGKAAVFHESEPYTFASYIIRVRFDEDVNPEFISIWLASPYGREWASRVRTDAIGQSNINGTSLGAFPISIPTRVEQDRIVDRVTRILRSVDRLQAAHLEKQQSRSSLARSSLKRLASHGNRFALDNLGEIIRTVDDVDELEHCFLALAVKGDLAPQLAVDGTGAQLLAQIKATEPAGPKRGRALKATNFGTLDFEIPDTWAWTTLAEIGEINPRNTADDSMPVAFIPMALFSSQFGEAPESENRTWSEVKSSFTHFADGDVVVAKITPCFENSKAAVIPELTNGIGAGTTELHVYRDTTGLMNPGYVYAWFKSPTFLHVGARHMTGTAGQKRLPREFVANFPFPLPPFREQLRIVERLSELMAMTRELRAALVA